ncbi:MAG TPA: 1-acyl-sn-glycerol-3-phosphate acyltransferase [Salinimicrobium sp.]|nr:1-acyl-sn-glycerol-3-phosphate acyltransferase [Salinimicrobium sp.]
MSEFDNIRFYKDEEVQGALQEYKKHPMIKALLHFTFPKKPMDVIYETLKECHSIRDFQTEIIYHSVQKVLEKSSEGLSYEGFEKLKKDESYLFISNHRDIILDTSLLNCTLFENDLVMTASAIGDNLVQKPFLMALSKLNRNFLVQRNLPPREMLKSSQNLSLYIKKLLLEDKRSVWMAQREGRTKDGSDVTQQGVLKMLAMAKGKESLPEYFSKLKIVPVAISYEFDPTDIMKMSELIAKKLQKAYVKTANEDFISILKGAIGNKGRIHITAGEIFDSKKLGKVVDEDAPMNEQLQGIATAIDENIYNNYKLWPSNYVATDLLNEDNKYASFYSLKEKRQFERRVSKRVDESDPIARNSYLLMYANPVLNREGLKLK